VAPTTTGPGTPVAALVATSWDLATYRSDGSMAPASAPATLTFDTRSRLSGSTGCNSFSGTYTVTDTKLIIALGPMTTKACTSAAVTAQEAALTEQLPMVRTYLIAARALTLSGTGGVALFSYKEATTTLAGTNWNVTGVNNGRGALETTSLTEHLTAAFGTTNEFRGFGGCNQLTGPYKLTEPHGLSVGPLMASKKACGTAVDQVEAEYLAALAKVATYSISGTTLTLRDTTNSTQVTAERT
jgi:heat shock protein HslJ